MNRRVITPIIHQVAQSNLPPYERAVDIRPAISPEFALSAGLGLGDDTVAPNVTELAIYDVVVSTSGAAGPISNNAVRIAFEYRYVVQTTVGCILARIRYGGRIASISDGEILDSNVGRGDGDCRVIRGALDDRIFPRADQGQVVLTDTDTFGQPPPRNVQPPGTVVLSDR